MSTRCRSPSVTMWRITDPPGEMFGKLMSVSDDLMWRYFDLLSFRRRQDLAALRRQVDRRP